MLLNNGKINLISTNMNPKPILNKPTCFLNISSESFKNLGKFSKLTNTFHATGLVAGDQWYDETRPPHRRRPAA